MKLTRSIVFTPKGLYSTAQGCRAAATLGGRTIESAVQHTPGGWLTQDCRCAAILGEPTSWGVLEFGFAAAQGSRCAATLGCGIQLLRGSAGASPSQAMISAPPCKDNASRVNFRNSHIRHLGERQDETYQINRIYPEGVVFHSPGLPRSGYPGWKDRERYSSRPKRLDRTTQDCRCAAILGCAIQPLGT